MVAPTENKSESCFFTTTYLFSVMLSLSKHLGGAARLITAPPNPRSGKTKTLAQTFRWELEKTNPRGEKFKHSHNFAAGN